MKFIPTEEIYKRKGRRCGLPAWAYNNAELAALEIEQIFLRNWLFVAHVAELARSGDYQCFGMDDERAVVLRDLLPVLELEQAPEKDALKQTNLKRQSQHKVATAS